MNLVQINERLKDMPMQAVQQYANGSNPSVPPYLALAEIQRRQKMQQQMANAQGAAQGQQPSVKEQIEQKAGLLGLQQAQMQQQQAQMMQPRPGPVPAGVPQPEPQPQAQEMAGGGIARIPVRNDLYQFANGGIIAFQAGGTPEVQRILKKPPRERTAEENAILERAGIKLQRQTIPQDSAISRANLALAGVGPGIREYFTEGASRMSDEELARMPSVGGAANERILRSLGLGQSLPPPPPPAPVAQQPAGSGSVPSEARLSAGIPALIAGAKPPAPPATSAPVVPPAATATPRPAPVAAPQETTSPFIAEAAAAAREKPVEPTAESIKAGVAALSPQEMTEEAMQKRAAEQRARAEGERSAFDKTRSTGLQDLIRVFGQAGQYKGMSGLAPAYTAMQQQKRAEELAMEKRQNELLTAIEGRKYEGAKELFSARTGAMEKAQQSYQNRLAANTKALADIANTDQRRIDEVLRRLSSMEVAKLQAATANRSVDEKLKFEADFLGLKSKARELAEKGDTQGAAKLEARANDMLTVRGGGVATERGPTPTDRLRAAQSILNDPMASDEEKTFARQEVKDLMSSSKSKTTGAQPLPANATPKDLAVGTVYQTARGPAKWDGKQFMPI